MVKPNQNMQMILDAHAAMGPLPIETLTPELARQIPLPDKAAASVYGHHFMKKIMAPMPLNVGKIEHRTIPGAEGELLMRLYTPKGDKPEKGWPILVYFHGGGWVIATLDTYDGSCRALCDATDCIVASVHYRQAPEHPWPAATHDAFAAYRWICANAGQLDGDASRIAVGGESAGGNLAAVVTLMARDESAMRPVHQLLVYPVTDIAHGASSASAQEYKDAKPLNIRMLHWFYNHYLSKEADRMHPYVSPLYADLKGLPAATIILAEIDPLRSEGEAYAQKLDEAGVLTDSKIFEGVTHEFFGMAGLVNEATDAVAMAARNLRKAFGNERDMVEKTIGKLTA